jgi:hypothetical protein
MGTNHEQPKTTKKQISLLHCGIANKGQATTRAKMRIVAAKMA